MQWQLRDLIDIHTLQSLMERFYAATAIPVGIIATDGEILVSTGWQAICSNFHRVHPVTAQRCRQSDDYIKAHLVSESFVEYKCRNGLWDLAVPIVIAGEHVATLFLGQFVYEDEEIDEEFFRRQAAEFGFDVDDYLGALHRIPVFTREKVRQIMDYYTSFVRFFVDIGFANLQRAEAEKALRESEAKFAAAFQTAPVSMAISTFEEGRYVEVNEEFVRHHGYSKEEAVGKTAAELNIWMDIGSREAIVAQIQRGEVIRDREVVMRDRYGKTRHGLYSAVAIDVGGEKRLLALRTDITAIKEAENALRESEEKFARTFRSAPSILAITSLDEGRFLDVNDAFEELLGYPREEVIGRTSLELAIWDPPEMRSRYFEILQQQGRVRGLEVRLRKKNGHVLFAMLSGEIIEVRGERCLLTLVNDITERKLAELEREQYAKFFPSAFELMCIAGNDGFFKKTNPSFTRTLGYTEEELQARPYIDFVHPDDREATVKIMAAGLGEELIIRNFENRFICKDGSIRWLSWNTHFRADDQLAFAVARDITEQKKIAAELALAQEAAERANRAKSEFLANMSHEIRTPLAGIMGMVQLLEYTELSADQQQYLDAIEISSENLLSLINDVLDLSKIEAGKIELERVAFSLRGSISDLLKTQISVIHSKGLNVRTEIPANVPDNVTGDQLRLKQVLLNLVSNAVKFTAKGGITVSVTLEERQGDNGLFRFSVSDTGIGIKPEVIDKIFAPFSQADISTTRNFGGTGLGLAICTKLVDLMGGTIQVESTEGRGSTFQVLIPFAVNEVQAERVERRKQGHRFEWEGPPLHILLAEDNEVTQRIIRELLQRVGHRMETAENGFEALAAWEQGGFDLILMDIEMPDMDGAEATRVIREREEETGRRVPIIALTANALREDREHLLSLGFDGYMPKPFKFKDLNDEILRCLKGAGGGSTSCLDIGLRGGDGADGPF